LIVSALSELAKSSNQTASHGEAEPAEQSPSAGSLLVAIANNADPNAPGRDAIVSRVIWLRGKEEQNLGAHERRIYIHGTPEERRIGRPASYGCIRMRSRDVIALYDFAHIGMHVTVTQKRTADLLPAEEPSLLARSD
jgi:L,D-transpeptidase catalytic domain